MVEKENGWKEERAREKETGANSMDFVNLIQKTTVLSHWLQFHCEFLLFSALNHEAPWRAIHVWDFVHMNSPIMFGEIMCKSVCINEKSVHKCIAWSLSNRNFQGLFFNLEGSSDPTVFRNDSRGNSEIASCLWKYWLSLSYR